MIGVEEILYNAIGHYRTKPGYALWLVPVIPIKQEAGAGFKMAIGNSAAARLRSPNLMAMLHSMPFPTNGSLLIVSG